MNIKTKQGFAIGLSLLGTVGTVGTAWLVRETAKKEVETYNGILPTKKENIMDLIKLYKLPIAVGAATVTSIIASTIMSRRAEASLLSMAVMADQGWRKYKHQVKSTLGLDKHNDILKSMSKKENIDYSKIDDTKTLYYDEMLGFFQANREDVIYAYATINEMMNTHLGTSGLNEFDGVSLYDFLELCDAKVITPLFKDEHLKKWGWSMDYLVEAFDGCWIHMGISDEVTEDGEMPYKVISWIEDPIHLESYDNNFDDKYSHEETRKLNFDDSIEDAAETVFKNK